MTYANTAPGDLCRTLARLCGSPRASVGHSDITIRRWQHATSDFDVEVGGDLVLMIALTDTYRVGRCEGRVREEVVPALGSVAALLPGHGARYAVTGHADVAQVQVTAAALERLGLSDLGRSVPDLHARRPPLERAAGAFLRALARREPLGLDGAVLLAAASLGRPVGHAGASPRLAAWQVRAVAELVEARLHHPLTVPDLARAAALSPSHFAHAFRATLGEPPWAFVQHRRLRRAMTMLAARRGQRVADIARECGFCDHQHLARVLKQGHGVTPRELRRAVA